MKKKTKIILAAVAAVIIGLAFGAETFFVIKTDRDRNAKIDELQAENDMLRQFVETNFDVELDKWADSDKTVAFTEEKLIKKIVDAIEEYQGIELDGIDDIDGLIEFWFDGGWYQEVVHDIYDDTDVVEAYKTGDTQGLSDEDKYVLDTASEIIDSIITDDMTDYEKELAVYNWQVEYVSYDESHFAAIPSDVNVDEYNYYPYGVLKYHSAICVGNATTFKLFMDMLDIDCMIIHSTEQGEHAWNLVKLEDDWYHVDVTFDSGFEGPDYAFFNVNDQVKQDGGYPWNKDDFPAAEGTKYNYGFNNAKEVENDEDILYALKETVDNGGGSVFLKSKTEADDMETVLEALESSYTDSSVYMYLSYETKVGEYYLYAVHVDKDDYADYWEEESTGRFNDLKQLIDGMF